MKNEKVLIKKHRPIVYEYYDWLKENALGEQNGVSRKYLADLFHIDLATQKKVLREINESEDLHKLVSTSGSIYLCNTKDECNRAIHNEITSGLARLLKGKKMALKMGKNNQYRIILGKYQKDIISVFEE